MRLDQYLVENGLFESRSKAQYAINQGSVIVNGSVCTKASANIKESDTIELDQNLMPYVGKGGLKLEGAISKFKIDANGKTAIDIGSSTGGFTDCLLAHGASKVLAVDIGKDQLHQKLREDKRVISLEQTDIRILTTEQVNDSLGNLPDLIVSDVSFISLLKIVQPIYTFSDENTQIVLLLKPQFETEGSGLGKNGILKDKKMHKAIAKRVISGLLASGIHVVNMVPSPIKGGDGNIEYLLYCKKVVDTSNVIAENYNTDTIIDMAFNA